MRIDGSPRAPIPFQAPAINRPAAGLAPQAVEPARVAGVGPAVSFGKAIPVSDPTSTADLARAAGYRNRHFERGQQLAANAPGPSPPPGEARDASATHPLYGRYVRQWTAAGGSAEPGQGLLTMMQQQLRDLQQTMRSLR